MVIMGDAEEETGIDLRGCWGCGQDPDHNYAGGRSYCY
jgi:hypothetical protein